jgi:hypothetical protein
MVALAHHWVGQVVRWLRCNSYQDLMLHGHTLTSNTQDKKTRQDYFISLFYRTNILLYSFFGTGKQTIYY